MYEALEQMGLDKGNVLEPSCGVGNFIGLMPEKLSGVKMYGVELDSVSGRIAKLLYPEATITVNGFEKTEFPDGFFDVAVGNVPFGGYKLQTAGMTGRISLSMTILSQKRLTRYDQAV